MSPLVPEVGEYGAAVVMSVLNIIVRNIITKAARVLHLKHEHGLKLLRFWQKIFHNDTRFTRSIKLIRICELVTQFTLDIDVPSNSAKRTSCSFRVLLGHCEHYVSTLYY